mgnify:FL=1
MQKYRIRNLLEELILVNIKENIDYYFEKEEYFKYLKSLLAKVDNENECYELLNNDNVYKSLMKDTIKDIRRLPYVYDFRYFLNEDLD